MSSFTIGGLAIGANGESDNGFFYNNLKDWYDVNQDQLDADSRPGQDGSFAPDESYSSQATPTLEGVFSGETVADAVRAKMTLRAMKNRGERVEAVFDDHGFVTRRSVFIMNVSPAHSASRPGFKWAIDMLAPDPALYGPQMVAGPVGPLSRGEGGLRFDEYTDRPATTGVGPGLVFPETYGTLGSTGRLSIVNEGSADTYSVFTFIGGSSGGFELTQISTGRVVSVVREIPEGAAVRVDMRTGRVTIDGTANDISGSVRSDDWWSTAPGTIDQVQLGILGVPYGSPSLSAETSSAY